jgi:hypothetical protein
LYIFFLIQLQPEVVAEVAASPIPSDEIKEENDTSPTTTEESSPSSDNSPQSEIRRRRVAAVESKKSPAPEK